MVDEKRCGMCFLTLTGGCHGTIFAIEVRGFSAFNNSLTPPPLLLKYMLFGDMLYINKLQKMH